MSQLMVIIPDELHERVRGCARDNGLKIKSMVIDGLKRVMNDYEDKIDPIIPPEIRRHARFHALLVDRNPREVAAFLEIPWEKFEPYVNDEKLIGKEALEFMRNKMLNRPQEATVMPPITE